MEEEIATHSSILGSKIPWTEQSGAAVHGNTRVGHDFATKPC